MTNTTLRDLMRADEEVELNLRVRGRITQVSDGHGLCIRITLERRNYATKVSSGAQPDEIDFRTVWVDADEIIEIQP